MNDSHDPIEEQPIVCTIRPGDDELEVMTRYRTLFADAYVGRERLADGVVWRFRADDGIVRRVRALAAIEQRCCAFLRIAVSAAAGEVRWDVRGPEAARTFLDEYYRLPEGLSESDERLSDRMSAAGLTFDDRRTRPGQRS
jgi:hypothetical protein